MKSVASTSPADVRRLRDLRFQWRAQCRIRSSVGQLTFITHLLDEAVCRCAMRSVFYAKKNLSLNSEKANRSQGKDFLLPAARSSTGGLILPAPPIEPPLSCPSPATTPR